MCVHHSYAYFYLLYYKRIINQSTNGVSNCPLSGDIMYCKFAVGEKIMSVIWSSGV